MLKITLIAISLLTVISMASNSQAMPTRNHDQSFQQSIYQPVVGTNNREQSEHGGRRGVERRYRVRAEGSRQYNHRQGYRQVKSGHNGRMQH
jgi:hypothetical protein